MPALQGISEMRTELGLPPQGTNLKVRREFRRFCSDLQWLMVKCSERMLIYVNGIERWYGWVQESLHLVFACICLPFTSSRSAQHWTLLDLWHPRANNCASPAKPSIMTSFCPLLILLEFVGTGASLDMFGLPCAEVRGTNLHWHTLSNESYLEARRPRAMLSRRAEWCWSLPQSLEILEVDHKGQLPRV